MLEVGHMKNRAKLSCSSGLARSWVTMQGELLRSPAKGAVPLIWNRRNRIRRFFTLATATIFVSPDPAHTFSLSLPDRESAFESTSRSAYGSSTLAIKQRPFSSLSSTRIDYFFSKSDDEEVDGDEATNSWLSWMRGGKPRGTNKVRLREAAELGGVPRSDRYMSKDWFHNTVTLPNSAILRDIKSPVLACTCWAMCWSFLHHHLKFIRHNLVAASHLYIPTAPHSLTMSALGLLLVFRTNSAYQRFAEGREIWERIINTSRDLYRYIMMYEDDITIEKRRRLQRLLAAFPYLLRHRIRPNLVMRRLDDDQYTRDPQNTILLYQDFGVSDLDEEAAKVAQTEEVTGQSRRKTRPLYWVDKRTLPWRLLSEEGALEKCARAQNRPLWVADRMAMELRSVPDSLTFTNRERMTLISLVDRLSHCIGAAERIHQTVVPLNYARHTLRALTLWLFSLPFSILKDLNLLTGPVVFVVSWLLFGVYEIGVRIEDPFQGTLRLSIMCDTIRRDVLADESIRSTAFVLEQSGERSTIPFVNSVVGSSSPPSNSPISTSATTRGLEADGPLLTEPDGEDDELTEEDLVESPGSPESCLEGATLETAPPEIESSADPSLEAGSRNGEPFLVTAVAGPRDAKGDDGLFM